MNHPPFLHWRGERITDLHAFCRKMGFKVALMRRREKYLMMRGEGPDGDGYSEWTEWCEWEQPEPFLNTMEIEQAGTRHEQEHIDTYDPKPEDPDGTN